ncbi:MAG: hypothetical protein OEQ53_05635, partial [Saprospiraceae bacterium]|nr:hypothetical protein [Saprospiraceae bacterium]
SMAPRDFRTHMKQAMMYALVGDRENAIRNSLTATEARSIQKDAILGPILQLEYAKVLTLLGDADKGLNILTDLFSIPSSLTANLLTVDPVWDGIRNNPRFTELLTLQKEIGRE